LVAKAMTAAQRHFRFVIVDLGVALSDVTLTVFDHSHRLALITPPEAAALRDTGELLSLLPSALNVPESQTTVILNHVSKYSQLNQKDVELIIDRKIDIEIAHDGPKPEKALLVGQLLAVTDPTSTITKGAAALAAILEGDRNRVGDHGGHAERDPEKAPAEDRSATPAQSQVQLSASSALLGTTA
ncbi:MAG TPA: hypothetical protein VG015_04395, partial [Candidatus Dormibacteraeota bacterium]|nr:hypothetical protein [Candidatus Dormibacteraeota bacterium]